MREAAAATAGVCRRLLWQAKLHLTLLLCKLANFGHTECFSVVCVSQLRGGELLVQQVSSRLAALWTRLPCFSGWGCWGPGGLVEAQSVRDSDPRLRGSVEDALTVALWLSATQCHTAQELVFEFAVGLGLLRLGDDDGSPRDVDVSKLWSM